MSHKRFQVQFDVLSPPGTTSSRASKRTSRRSTRASTGLCRGETEALLATSMSDRNKVAWGPLAHGQFAGASNADTRFESGDRGCRGDAFDMRLCAEESVPRSLARVGETQAPAAERGMAICPSALAWTLSSPMVGARTPAAVDANPGRACARAVRARAFARRGGAPRPHLRAD